MDAGHQQERGQWGTAYPEAENLGTVTMAVFSRERRPGQRGAIAVADTPAGGELHLTWENTKAVATFAVK